MNDLPIGFCWDAFQRAVAGRPSALVEACTGRNEITAPDNVVSIEAARTLRAIRIMTRLGLMNGSAPTEPAA